MNLKNKVITGGMTMVIRKGIGMVISFLSLLFVTKVIGPTEYGVFASAYGIQSYLIVLGQLGISIYLIRSSSEMLENNYSVASTISVISGLLIVIVMFLALPLLQDWVRLPGFSSVMTLLLLTLPLQILILIPTAKMEREINYSQIAFIEIIVQVTNVFASILLAWKGWGALAPAFGLIISQIIGIIMSYHYSGLKFKLSWEREEVNRILRYSTSYSISVWIWQMRQLINPLIISRLLGADAVGIIALSIKFVDLLSFVKSVVYRISISALSKVKSDHNKLTMAIEEGANLQVFAVGLPLVIFALVAPVILPRFFGSEWLDSMSIFPLIAVVSIINSVFNLHSSVLYIFEKNREVSWFHTIYIVIFLASAFLLIPRFGIFGYGIAEILSIVSYVFLHFSIKKLINPPNYLYSIIAAFALCLSLFYQNGGLIMLIPLLLVLSLPKTRLGLLRLLNNARM